MGKNQQSKISYLSGQALKENNLNQQTEEAHMSS